MFYIIGIHKYCFTQYANCTIKCISLGTQWTYWSLGLIKEITKTFGGMEYTIIRKYWLGYKREKKDVAYLSIKVCSLNVMILSIKILFLVSYGAIYITDMSWRNECNDK